MKTNNKNNNGVQWSVGGLGSKMLELEKELQALKMDNLELIQNMISMHNKYNYVHKLFLDTQTFQEEKEIEMDIADFQDNYTEIIGDYYFHKPTSSLRKVISVYKGWNFNKEETMELQKLNPIGAVFSHPEFGNIAISGASDEEIRQNLKVEIRAQHRKPKLEIIPG